MQDSIALCTLDGVALKVRIAVLNHRFIASTHNLEGVHATLSIHITNELISASSAGSEKTLVEQLADRSSKEH